MSAVLLPPLGPDPSDGQHEDHLPLVSALIKIFGPDQKAGTWMTAEHTAIRLGRSGFPRRSRRA